MFTILNTRKPKKNLMVREYAVDVYLPLEPLKAYDDVESSFFSHIPSIHSFLSHFIRFSNSQLNFRHHFSVIITPVDELVSLPESY